MEVLKLDGLDLFSGIGGNSLALSEWVNVNAYCEQDSFAQSVLLSNMQRGLLPHRPIWDDVRTLTGSIVGDIDIITAGFPCQNISVAGNGEGLAGKQSGLFYEIVRVTKEINPTFVFLENVPAIRTRGLSEIVRTFTDLRYECRWTCVSAAEVGAPHLRKRWFLLAYSHSNYLRKKSRGSCGTEDGKTTVFPRHDGEVRNVTDTNGIGSRQGRKESNLRQRESHSEWDSRRQIKPTICGSDDVVPNRVDRIKCLGNAVVPAQAKEAFCRLMGLK